MKAEEAKNLEKRLVETGRIFTAFVAILLLAVAYLVRGSFDWRVFAGLACLALIVQFGIVEPGIRRTCRDFANPRKQKKN
ncbi:MAG: hypothetical protein KGH63_03490 [Candidatus Micrarchaeota archaeon]|nr:hypothetical protein [Candidatus Micrarchaeota archaeon]